MARRQAPANNNQPFLHRHAYRFLAHHGVVHLAGVLSLAYTRPPGSIVRYGVAAAEALVLSTGGLG